MLQIHEIREKRETIINSLQKKNFTSIELIDEVILIDENRRKTQKELDEILSENNKIAKEIGLMFKSGDKESAEKLKARSILLKNEIKGLEERLRGYEKTLEQKLTQIPNIAAERVPFGNTSEDNEVVFSKGAIKASENLSPHWDVAEKTGIIDFKTGNKITGAGFPVYVGKGARLQRALVSFFLDQAIAAGYQEYQPPLLINEASGFGTGQLPDKEGQMYHIVADNLYLIPTAEVPVTNFYRDVILEDTQLPVKNVAYSACFRREAGSYGKDVRGLNRLHQFDKVEIVQITTPENSYDTLEKMVEYVSSLIDKLGLPYRSLLLCGGDLSFTSACTYDLEVYAKGQNKWLEVSSVSNFETYQSNRMKIRYKDQKSKKPRLVHTLNGSALALPRIVAALLENNQTKKGIEIPEVLQPYTGFDFISYDK